MADEGPKVGFIGCGRMATAMAGGLIAAGFTAPTNIIGSDLYQGAREAMARLGASSTESSDKVIEVSKVVILAVKPNDVVTALASAGRFVTADHVFVSICAGVTIATLEECLPEGTQVVRVMPNTPCLVGALAAGMSPNAATLPENKEMILKLLQSLGVAMEVKEPLLDAVTGLSGSGPAYMFLAIEAMADGGVFAGLPRNVALKLAAQTMMGAAKMVLDTGLHPGELKDQVTSPGGTTIAGVRALEEGGFRSCLINAVAAATTRAGELGKK